MMNKSVSAAVAAICLLAAGSAGAKTVKNYTFTLTPGGTKTIALPAGGYPVVVQTAISGAGGTLPGSELVSTTISQDPSTTQLGWVATNNLGTQTVGNTTTDTTIARIYLPGQKILATLSAATSGGKYGSITFSTDSSDTGSDITFYTSFSY